MRKIYATVSDCRQVGINEYRDYHTTREVAPETTIGELLEWAGAALRKDAERTAINDIQFSESED